MSTAYFPLFDVWITGRVLFRRIVLSLENWPTKRFAHSHIIHRVSTDSFPGSGILGVQYPLIKTNCHANNTLCCYQGLTVLARKRLTRTAPIRNRFFNSFSGSLDRITQTMINQHNNPTSRSRFDCFLLKE